MGNIVCMRPRLLLILAALGACAYHPDDFARPSGRTAPEDHAATPPAPPIPEGEALYQMLYADEFGEDARALGQRARMLAWLHSSGLRDAQLEGLIVLARVMKRAVAEDDAARVALGPREKVLYGPIYTELIGAFSGTGSLSAEDLARHAENLRQARSELWGEEDPHKAQYQRLKAALGSAQKWVRTLSYDQQQSMTKTRFFLRRSLSPLSRPGHYEFMVAGTWDAGDFDTLRYAGRSPNEDALNIGGLWSAEAYRVRPGEHLTALQTQALVARAVLEPGFIEAIEVVLGRRDPMSFD
jgi:hypothetical protein